MPTFTATLGKLDGLSPQEAVGKIANHLRVIQEQLEYRLSCLDSSNITEINMLDTAVYDEEGKSVSKVLADQAGNIAALQFGETLIVSTVRDNIGRISRVEQTADGLKSTVLEQGQSISQIEQTSDQVSVTVTALAGKYSTTLGITSSGVIIKNNGTEDAVKIDGSQIEANTVKTSALHLYGDLTVYTADTGGSVGGYLGYTSSAQDGSAAIHMKSPGAFGTPGVGEVSVTDNGARMSFVYGGYHNQAYIAQNLFGIEINGSSYSFGSGGLVPTTGMSLGDATHLWSAVYAANGTIQPSDRRVKRDISYDLSRYDRLWEQLRPCSGQYIDSDTGTHLFLIAQDVEDAMQRSGLSGHDFGGLVKDADGDDVRYALRYAEFIPLCIRRIQRLEEMVERIGT